MSSNNPSITAADIVTDVENRLDDPGISGDDYLPWISYAYQKTYQVLANSGQEVKENLFGDYATYNLTAGTAEYTLTDIAPRFGGFIKVEIKYGGTGDDWVRASKLRTISHWNIQNNTSTSYRSKTEALYYQLGPSIGFIPTPPSTDAGTPTIKLWYIKRPYAIDESTDVIDIPYRFIYPIVNYVHARAMERENEDYAVANVIDAKFEADLLKVQEAVVSEYNENDGTLGIEVDANSAIFDNPLGV